MTVGQKIREARLKKGYSQAELAELLGYKSRSSINKIEVEGRDIPRSSIVKFAKVLDVTPSYLMGWEDEPNPTEPEQSIYDQFDNIYPVKLKRFPLLGKIACGEPIYAEEDHENFISANADIRADFCLRASGNSMINAEIYDGDIVFIRKQPVVDNGEIAAVIIDNEATLKRVYFDKENERLQLVAENPAYAPLVYIGQELEYVRILGKAVALMRNI